MFEKDRLSDSHARLAIRCRLYKIFEGIGILFVMKIVGVCASQPFDFFSNLFYQNDIGETLYMDLLVERDQSVVFTLPHSLFRTLLLRFC